MLFREIICENHMKQQHSVKFQFVEVKVGDTYIWICLPTFKHMNMICTSNCKDILWFYEVLKWDFFLK
jgi:hypothetical protein